MVLFRYVLRCSVVSPEFCPLHSVFVLPVDLSQ